jgi:hypothetical protein
MRTSIVLALLLALFAVAAYAQVPCDTQTPIVDSFNYNRGSEDFFTALNLDEKQGELFFTGPADSTGAPIRLSSVAILLQPLDDPQAPSRGSIELWNDDGGQFPNNLPGELFEVLGNFTSPTVANSTTEINVEALEIDLEPETPYWLVVRSVAGVVRWAFTDYAFLEGCPDNGDADGRFGQVYAFANATSNTWNDAQLSYGFIGIMSLERCGSANATAPATPTPVPVPTTPTPVPTTTPAPRPSVGPRHYVRSE